MINETILNYLIIFIALELYEVSWQKADSIMGMLIQMYKQYSKSIFLFLLMNPTFYFSIWFAMISEYSISAMVLLFLKTMDVATKILLIEMVFIKKEVTQDLAMTLLTPINKFLPYIGLIIYPVLILLV